jgi:hypothetical protein
MYRFCRATDRNHGNRRENTAAESSGNAQPQYLLEIYKTYAQGVGTDGQNNACPDQVAPVNLGD